MAYLAGMPETPEFASSLDGTEGLMAAAGGILRKSRRKRKKNRRGPFLQLTAGISHGGGRTVGSFCFPAALSNFGH